MRNMLWLLIFISLYSISCAQSRPPVKDTVSAPPNTVRIIGQIKKADKRSVTITITKIIDQGQGLINALSEGEDVTVTLPEKSKISAGSTVEAYLKEKMGMDASQVTYQLTSFKAK